jgi:protein-tyrosine phosphatase
LSHPLQIAVVVGHPFPGALGVTFAPGKHDSIAITGAWARDLGVDLDAIVAWGAKALVTLIEPHEFDLLGIPRLGDEARRRGLDWLHLPIRDVSTPGCAFEAAWPDHSANLRKRLAAGESVVVHCRGGLGRAGMIAARLLAESGVDPDAAMARVRAVRPGAIETPAQEEWVRTGPRAGESGTPKF